jgi:hypothetical protein
MVECLIFTVRIWREKRMTFGSRIWLCCSMTYTGHSQFPISSGCRSEAIIVKRTKRLL